MTDWYRRKTWTKNDEDEFFTKLHKAKIDKQVQYLRIQAIELMKTNNEAYLDVVEKLLNKILIDYLDNNFEKSLVFNTLGEIYLKKENYEKALSYFAKSLAFEKEFPNLITTSYLNFSETVIKTKKIELYEEVEKILLKKIEKDTFRLPAHDYIAYSVLSVISDFKGDIDKAKNYAVLVEKNATTKTNGLVNVHKRKIGLVKERKTWLDKLLRKDY